MKLDTCKLKSLREEKAWSQAHLADVAGVSLRTIQRIEKSGIASPESVKAICASYDIEVSTLINRDVRQGDTPDGNQVGGAGLVWGRIGRAEILATMAAFAVAFIMAFYFST